MDLLKKIKKPNEQTKHLAIFFAIVLTAFSLKYLVEKGFYVRTIVRPFSDFTKINDLGVEIFFYVFDVFLLYLLNTL